MELIVCLVLQYSQNCFHIMHVYQNDYGCSSILLRDTVEPLYVYVDTLKSGHLLYTGH